MLNCPLCRVPMREVSKEGVLIDVCMQCRGVWLDRGELEKIIASSKEVIRDYDEIHRNYAHDEHDHNNDKYRHMGQDRSDYHYKKKKKHGVLKIFEDLFD